MRFIQLTDNENGVQPLNLFTFKFCPTNCNTLLNVNIKIFENAVILENTTLPQVFKGNHELF